MRRTSAPDRAPLRALIVAPTLGDGGADRVVQTLLGAFVAAGRIRPTLVLMRREGALVDRIPPGVPVHVLGTRRLAASVPALARVIRHERPDVVVCLHGSAGLVVTAAHLVAGSRARIVLGERSALVRDDRSARRTAVEHALKRILYRRADVVTAVSAGVGRDLVERLGLPEPRVHVVYNPVVEDDLAAQAAAPVEHPWFAGGRAGGVPVIVAAGRLVAIKDYPTLLAAFARVRARLPVRLAILGEGPLRGALEARIAAGGLAADVALLGFQANPFRFMARARLLLHASRAEGLPGALIQAMACGAPVVSTDCDFGPREVVTDGSDGFLVPVGDGAALADRVTAVLTDDALAARLGEAARASAARFSAAAVIARYERAITGEP